MRTVAWRPFLLRWAGTGIGILVLSTIAFRASADAPAGARRPACDRACLDGTVDRYMAALAAHEPGQLRWAPDARLSENNVMLPVGDGLWRTISAPPRAVLEFEDPESGQAGALALIEQRGRPAYFAMRLTVRDGEISEVETQINEPAAGAQPSPAAGDPKTYFHYPQMSAELPPDERTPRLRMIDLVYGYFSTLQLNDGVLLTAFDPGCRRQENGFESTANPRFKRPEGKLFCAAQFQTGTFRFDTAVRDRDFMVVDEAHGLVLARAFIDHDAAAAEYRLADGTRVANPVTKPESLSLLELFHITRGRIDRIEAVHIPVPYGMPSVWRRTCP
jgi:hypothetical protein